MIVRAQTEVGERILDHVGRYRLSTSAVIDQLPEFRNQGRRELRHELHQLSAADYLGAAPLFRNQRYYFLGPANRRRAPGQNGNEDGAGPLSELAKIRNYAMLSFCCLGKHRRQRLTSEELQRHLPGLVRPGLPLNYYLDRAAAEARLGFLRVDTGGRGRWDRILEKARADMKTHWGTRELRGFIERGLFEITIITALPQKATRLREALDSWTDGRKALIRICICPDLINLIAPPPS